MHVVIHIDGRDAVPVRAVLLATVGNVTAQGLALELAKPDAERGLTAYRYSQVGPVPVRADAWDMQHEILTGIVRRFKREEPQSDDLEQVEHRDAAWRKSLELLPAGVFVWLDELESWYGTTFYSPNSVLEVLQMIPGEDDDPEPQYQLRPSVDNLDLFPIAMADCEDLVFKGFESHLAKPGETSTQVVATPAPTVATSEGTAPLNTIIHSTKTRRDTLTPVIELAQSQCRNLADTAEVWAALLVMAEKKTAPLIGATEDGLQYLKGGTAEIFTRKSLGKRLAR